MRPYTAEEQRELRRRARERGDCTTCYRARPTTGLRCDDCRARARARDRNRRDSRRVNDCGTCYRPGHASSTCPDRDRFG